VQDLFFFRKALMKKCELEIEFNRRRAQTDADICPADLAGQSLQALRAGEVMGVRRSVRESSIGSSSRSESIF